VKFHLLSEREASESGAFPPPPNLRSFPKQLRRNISSILSETLGRCNTGHVGIGNRRPQTTQLWVEFDRILKRESATYCEYVEGWGTGVLEPKQRILDLITRGPDAVVQDILDVGVVIINVPARQLHQGFKNVLPALGVISSVDNALGELDLRLREHGTVYRVADGKIIVSSDDFTHEKVVVPALQVLGEPGFENASHEFHEALEAYRNGKYDIALNKANHAFESTMKIIAGKMKWAYDDTATAKKMLDVMFNNGLLPTMRDTTMKSLATMMESDVPTLRNKMPSAGHGAGEKDADIPEAFAVYIISAAAANIRLLIESYRVRRQRS
jgi:hypothetical protein